MATSAHWETPLPTTTTAAAAATTATATATTIKELFDSGAVHSAVPAEYCFGAPHHDSIVEEDFPTIDLSLLRDGTDGQKKKAIRELGKACEDWGFFSVVNHGVPMGTIKAMLGAAQGFFSLPEAEKREFAGKNMLDPIRCGTSFNLTVEDTKYWRDYFKLIVHPDFSSPTKPPGFREALLDYAQCVRKMMLELLRGVNESLGLEEHCMERALDLDSGMQLVAGNLYPPCPQPELAMGLPPHSDYGLLTALLQHGVDGLQVKHGGNWVNVRPPPDAFLVNIGDQMEIFSNGRYKSVIHRAMLNNHTTRMSIVVVQGPSLEAYVQPALQLLSGNGHRVAYRVTKYRDYVEYQQANPLKEKSVLDLVRMPVEQSPQSYQLMIQ